MSSCIIDNITAKNAIENKIESELSKTGMFDIKDNLATPKEVANYQPLIDNINRAFKETVIYKEGDSYRINVSDNLAQKFFFATSEGKNIEKIAKLFQAQPFPQSSPNKGSFFEALVFPEITQLTYDKLVNFVKKVNPKFRVELLDNLSQDGLTELKDFLISVRTVDKFRALPEEVSHVVIEMLPDDSSIKQELLSNITSFPIYEKTLKQYSEKYKNSDGSINYDKIKREAAAKLLAEYFYAVSTGDKTRLAELHKPKDGWLKRLFNAIMVFFGKKLSEETNLYWDVANDILDGTFEANFKTEDDVAEMSFTDSYWFKLSDEQLYMNAADVINIPPTQLMEVITKFNRDFGRRFNEILKDKKFEELDRELKRTGTDVGRINKLVEIKNNLSDANMEMRNVLDSDAMLKGTKQFLEAIDSMEILAKAIYNVVNSKAKVEEFDEAIKNIQELQGYVGLYQTFISIIDDKFMNLLVEARDAQGKPIALDIIQSINNSKSYFDSVNKAITSRLRQDLFVFVKGLMNSANKNTLEQLDADIALEQSRTNPSKDILDNLKARKEKLIQTDEKILSVLSGRGKDVDIYSNLNYLLNASILNGDMYISSISRFINDKLENRQMKASGYIRSVYSKIHDIQEKLGETAVETGTKITFVDKVYDPSTGESRETLTWLNPHKDIFFVRDQKKSSYEEAYKEYQAAGKVITDEKTALQATMLEKKKDYYDFLAKYFNRPFTKEYYDFREVFEANPVFVEAMSEYQDYGERISKLEEELKVEPEKEDIVKMIALLRRERSNLLSEFDTIGDKKTAEEIGKVNILKQYFDESGKFKELDDVQTERSFLISKNRYEQKIDFALQSIRTGNINKIEDVETKLQETLNDKRLRIVTLHNILNENDGIDLETVKEILMEKWLAKNKFIERNDKFYEDEQFIISEIKKLKGKGVLSPIEARIADLYEDLRNVLFGSRDTSGHINPDSLTEEESEKIMELEELLAEAKASLPKATLDVNEMSPEDKTQYDALMAVISDPNIKPARKIDANKKKRKLEQKYKNSPKNKEIKELYAILGAMSNKVPTHYYWERLETMIPALGEFVTYMTSQPELEDEEKEMVKTFYDTFVEAVDTIDTEQIDFDLFTDPLFSDFLEYIGTTNTKFKSQFNWFAESHAEKTVWDNAYGKYIKIPFARTAIWQFKEPIEDDHKKESYNRKYLKYKVKDEYRTPEVVGETVSNRETANGFKEFLPLTPEQGAPKDSPYTNEEYYRMKNSTDPKDKLRFEYLQQIQKADLETQQLVPARLRRWNHAPVTPLSNIEEKTKIPETLKTWKDKVVSIFKKNEAGDAQAAIEGDDTIEEVDQLTQELITERIPKLGMAQRLPVERVSRDMLKATAMSIIRSYEFDARSEAQPVMEALLSVMKDNPEFRKVGNKERLKIFERMYSQKILSESPETLFNQKWMRRITKILTANTALRLVADPVGGAINYLGANVNNIIEAFACKYINPVEYLKGNMLSTRVNTHLMADFHKKANLSTDTLLFLQFDFLQGEFEEDLLDRSSSRDKASSIQQILMLPRKAGELMAQTAMAMGMMERIKVTNSIDGKKYPVHEIYKAEGNTLVLKEGFPAEYAPGGTEFMRIKKLINRVNLELHGNYARINQSEASRHSIGKLAENMKRWFMPAITRRFGRESIDMSFEDLNEGYYRTAARAAYSFFKNVFTLQFGEAASWFNHFKNTPRYRQNLQRAGADLGLATLMFLTFSLLMGYSGDDKNKELKENSWLHNMAILILLRSYSETTAFIPFPPFGFQEMKRNILTPLALPADAVSNFAAIGQLGLYHVLSLFGADFEKDLYYSKNSGYWFSEKGDSKFMKYIFKTMGLNASTINPDQYIKDFQNLQARLK